MTADRVRIASARRSFPGASLFARINTLFARFNSLFDRLGNLLAGAWKTNALPARIPS
jgi:hypothetical protein